MGCNVSHGPTFPARLRPLLLQRFDEIKARRHHACHSLKEPTPSKKELLSQSPDDIDRNTDDDITTYQHLLPPSPSKTEDHAMKPDSEPSKNHGNKDCDVIEENVVNDVGYKTEMKEVEEEEDRVKAKAEDVFTDADDDVEDDDDGDDANDDHDDDSDNVNERKIGQGEDGAFPGSPSFRVYFKDNEAEDGHGGKGKDDASKKQPISSKEAGTPSKESSMEKKAKKGKKKRSFRKVLPKNLLGVKSCYTPSHHHSRTSSLDSSQIHAAKSTP